MGFVRAFNRRITPSDIHGFAGGTLQDQLERDDDPRRSNQSPDRMSGVASSQVPPTTMADRYMAQLQPVDQVAQRPRAFADRFMQQPQSPQPATPEPNAPFGSSGEPLGAQGSRPRWSGPRDYVADDSQYLRDVENQPLSLRDKAGLVAQNIATNLGGKPLPTRRQRDIEQATGQLGRDVAIEKEQTAQNMSRMVPITDKDGNVIGYSPARTAAGTQVRATDTGNRLVETKRRNDAYIGHLEDVPKEKQADRAYKMWKAGLGDGNPELKTKLAEKMGVTGELPDSDKGTIEVGADGAYKVIHTRTNTVTTPTETTTTPEGVTTQAPVGSFKETQETNKDTRLQKRQTFEREMKSLDRAAAEKRARIMVQGAASRLGDADEYGTMADKLDDEAGTAESSNTRSGRQAAIRLRALANQNRVLASKARSAQEGAGTQPAINTGGGSFNLGAWKADHPNATSDQVNAMRAKAKARNMSVVE